MCSTTDGDDDASARDANAQYVVPPLSISYQYHFSAFDTWTAYRELRRRAFGHIHLRNSKEVSVAQNGVAHWTHLARLNVCNSSVNINTRPIVDHTTDGESTIKRTEICFTLRWKCTKTTEELMLSQSSLSDILQAYLPSSLWQAFINLIKPGRSRRVKSSRRIARIKSAV